MSIEELLEEIEDIVDGAWHIPLSGGRALVNANEIKKLMKEIKTNMPKEVEQAKNIVSDRKKILDDAKNEAQNIMKMSVEKIKSMVNQNEITKNARKQAEEIINEAKTKSKEIKISANEYVANIMQEIDLILTENLSNIKKSKQFLSKSLNNDIKQNNSK